VSGAAPDAPRLFDHLDASRVPAAPREVDHGTGVDARAWGRMLNDRLRTCAFSAAGHLTRCWSARSGAGPVVCDDAILAAYEAVSGYDRAGPRAGDVGAYELDALEHWRLRGIGDSRIDAYAAISPGAATQVRTAIAVFGGCYATLDLPTTAQSQDVWQVPEGGITGRGAPGTWIAHAVALVGYDDDTVASVAWGARKPMTWDFLASYAPSAYAAVSTQAWFVDGVPAALDLEGLCAALDRLHRIRRSRGRGGADPTIGFTDRLPPSRRTTTTSAGTAPRAGW
jgi:hypothetical protein